MTKQKNEFILGNNVNVVLSNIYKLKVILWGKMATSQKQCLSTTSLFSCNWKLLLPLLFLLQKKS